MSLTVVIFFKQSNIFAFNDTKRYKRNQNSNLFQFFLHKITSNLNLFIWFMSFDGFFYLLEETQSASFGSIKLFSLLLFGLEIFYILSFHIMQTMS